MARFVRATVDRPLGGDSRDGPGTTGSNGRGEFDVVTGAFGYSGKAIAAALQGGGRQVRTLTNHPAPSGSTVEVRPLAFDRRASCGHPWKGPGPHQHLLGPLRSRPGRPRPGRCQLESPLRGGSPRGRRAHRPCEHHPPGPGLAPRLLPGQGPGGGSPPPVRGALLVLRPAVLFGGNGVLINNIAWLLRRLPIFAVGGRGLPGQGIHVDDLAQLCLEHAGAAGDQVLDAVGRNGRPLSSSSPGCATPWAAGGRLPGARPRAGSQLPAARLLPARRAAHP